MYQSKMTSVNGKRREFGKELINIENNYKRCKISNNDVLITVKQEKPDNNDLDNFTSHVYENNFGNVKRYIVENSLPKIAIKKIKASSTGRNNEVVLLNGNWDTRGSNGGIPNIVAEMHEVKMEDINTAWGNELLQSNIQHGVSNMVNQWGIHQEQITGLSSSPQGSDSGLGNDSPEGNLSWLLNFKLDDLPGLPDYPAPSNNLYNGRKVTATNGHTRVSPVYITDNTAKNQQYYETQKIQNVNITRLIQDQQQQQQNNREQDGNLSSTKSPRYSNARKPPFTYTELIEHALREKGELTVSGIYQWISDHFSFYKANDDRWKNSVRHNLSINPHFRKGSKAVHGAGHLWTIAHKDDDFKSNSSWNVKKQRMQQFMATTASEWQKQREQELELAAATASIMQPEQHEQEQYMQQGEIGKSRTPLHQAAEEILGGVKREVEVQYVVPVTGSMDFMCPITKEQVAEECGLGNDELQPGNDYLITDLNPNTLGLNLTEAEIITPDQLFSDDLTFQCYELTTEH